MKKEEKARKERRKSKIVAFFGSYYLAIWRRDNSKREEEGEEEAEGKGRGRKRILIWKLLHRKNHPSKYQPLARAFVHSLTRGK